MESLETTVIIIESDQKIRHRLEKLLNGHQIKTLAFKQAESFLNYQQPLREPSCLLAGFYLDDMSGLELLRLLSHCENYMATVFFAENISVEETVSAIRGGAVDFIKMPCQQQSLLTTVQRALYQDFQLKKRSQEKRHALSRFRLLTPREQDIFNHVVTGLLNKQIAWKLGICEKTVKVHRAQVMKKTGVKSLADLVRLSETLKNNGYINSSYLHAHTHCA